MKILNLILFLSFISFTSCNDDDDDNPFNFEFNPNLTIIIEGVEHQLEVTYEERFFNLQKSFRISGSNILDVDKDGLTSFSMDIDVEDDEQLATQTYSAFSSLMINICGSSENYIGGTDVIIGELGSLSGSFSGEGFIPFQLNNPCSPEELAVTGFFEGVNPK